jgi:nucleoside diphosphate kinase
MEDERTIVLIKPLAITKQFVGTIIQKLETDGYELVALKMLKPSELQIEVTVFWERLTLFV